MHPSRECKNSETPSLQPPRVYREAGNWQKFIVIYRKKAATPARAARPSPETATLLPAPSNGLGAGAEGETGAADGALAVGAGGAGEAGTG